MAARPDFKPENCLFVTRIVETSTIATLYAPVMDGNADGECQPLSGVASLAIGVVTDLLGGAGVAGTRVQVALFNGAVVPVQVGVGGTATRGQVAKYITALGVTNAVPAGAGTTATVTLGIFQQSGVAGDIVGMQLIRGWVTE